MQEVVALTPLLPPSRSQPEIRLVRRTLYQVNIKLIKILLGIWIGLGLVDEVPRMGVVDITQLERQVHQE